MQQIPRLRNLLILRNSSISHHPQSAGFHSTPVSLAKWKSKWNFDAGRGQQPSKNYVRYATRQKRADTKKALNDLLFHSSGWRPSSKSFQVDDVAWDNDRNSNRNSEGTKRPGRRARQSSHGGKKCKKRNVDYSDYDIDPDSIFRETIGGKCFTWSFRSWDGSDFQCSSFGFEWRENESNWARNNKRVVWNTSSEEETDSEDDIDEELSTVGSCSNRMILGLPPRGSLKINDVKSAFRSCALKWHPDKHQGPSQAMAAEKFKQCSEAYQFLCKELTPAQPA